MSALNHLKVVKQTTETQLRLGPVTMWDCKRSHGDGTQNWASACKTEKKTKQGGIHICSCLMLLRVLMCVCVHVLICDHVSEMRGGPLPAVPEQETHVFS